MTKETSDRKTHCPYLPWTIPIFLPFHTVHGVLQTGILDWVAVSFSKRRREVAETDMVGWHHGPNGHEFEPTPGDSGGQRRLACCSPWDRKESDTA